MEEKLIKDNICDTKLFYFAFFSIAAMTVLGGAAISPSLPSLEKHFSYVKNIDIIGKFVLTTPALFVIFFSPISGFLFDKFGRLKLMYPAMIVWSLSGVAGFFLDNVYHILISRAIFGIATAFVMTGSAALLADYYSGAKRERAISIQGFYTSFGGATFLTISGFLSNINWRYPFLVYLLGLVVFFLASRVLFEPARKFPNKAKPKEESTDESFHISTFLPIYFLGFCGISLYYIIPTQVPFFIVDVLHKGGELVGISVAVSSISGAMSSLFYARVRYLLKLEKESMYCIGFSLVGLGFCLIHIFHSYNALLLSLIFIGSGYGIFLVTNASWLFSLTKDSFRAKAYGFLASSYFLGQFLSPIITQPIVEMINIVNMFLAIGIISLLFGIWFFIEVRLKNIKTAES
ncbi:hypothetical protein CCY99_02905 [Helicobacter sp. 16-1353]|uniref:MFS transporter n=1 Tax=Helicobacter sp. 16-1353 TaxID=2004996 RepID=UPI000DCCEA44|nr:MFS transporter [Helicobacter sp. 16-1353]RAX54725.1 hypothetical protein CCY99_02905 [Helicobacter sp. 16-1353]